MSLSKDMPISSLLELPFKFTRSCFNKETQNHSQAEHETGSKVVLEPKTKGQSLILE